MPKKTPKKRVSKSSKFHPVPKEFHTVTPYLAINGAAEAIEWYTKAFGAKELQREQGPGGKLIHGRIQIGDSIVMLSDIFPGAVHKDPRELGASSVTLHIYSKAVDALWKKTVEAGARVDMQLDDMFWGERYGQLTDPFGNAWSLSMQIQMSPEEIERKRQEAMKMFEQGQHPSHDDPSQSMWHLR
ncbi:MAG: VOC family protein [Candidatus Bathyarchaeia archaeon]|jgi:uncharacterized glyoxalase superfamily protein PhnB